MRKFAFLLLVVSTLIAGTAFGDTLCANLTTASATGTCNGGYFIQIPQQSTGTGVFPSFIQVHGSTGTDAIEQSYSTNDFSGANNEAGSSAQHNFAVLLSALPTYTGGQTIDGFFIPLAPAGDIYVRFTLDVNESGGQGDNFLSLDQLTLSTSTSSTLHPDITVNGSDVPTPPSLGTPVYNLDGNANNWIALDYALNSGSGSGDMWAYLPISLAAYNACIASNCYAYLYSAFGIQGVNPAGAPAGLYGATDGFEEWAYPGISNSNTVPEPVTSSLIGTGLIGLYLLRRRSRKA